MDPISGLNQILQLARARLNRAAGQSPSHATSRPSGNAAQGVHTANASPEQLKRKLHERISALEVTEASNTQATRIFVETVLTWEFGDELFNDPQFTQLAQEVTAQINADDIARERMTVLLGELRRTNRKP